LVFAAFFPANHELVTAAHMADEGLLLCTFSCANSFSAEVVAWLKSLKLDKYTDVFAENEVDMDTLPHLTEHDLEKMGMFSSEAAVEV
jgi:hypothetical protein